MRYNSLKAPLGHFSNNFLRSLQNDLVLNTNISGTAYVLKLKLGLSNSICCNRCAKFLQNLRRSPGELIKILLSSHGMAPI